MKSYKTLKIVSIAFILIVTILIIYLRNIKPEENTNQVLSNKQVISSESVKNQLTTPISTPVSSLVNATSYFNTATNDTKNTITKSPYIKTDSPTPKVAPVLQTTNNANHLEYKNFANFFKQIKEFEAFPVKIKEDNWLAKLAGGADKTIKVAYGRVYSSANLVGEGEEYLTLSGANGTIKYAANSYSKLADCETYQFWSCKTIQGSTVVKDFTSDTIQIVNLYLYNDGTNKLSAYTHNKNSSSDSSWDSSILNEGFYTEFIVKD